MQPYSCLRTPRTHRIKQSGRLRKLSVEEERSGALGKVRHNSGCVRGVRNRCLYLWHLAVPVIRELTPDAIAGHIRPPKLPSPISWAHTARLSAKCSGPNFGEAVGLRFGLPPLR